MAYWDKIRERYRGSYVRADGKRRTKLFGEKGRRRKKDLDAAIAWEQIKKTERKLKRLDERMGNLKTAIDDYIEYCEQQEFHPTTIKNKRYILGGLLKSCKSVTLENISLKTLQDFIHSHSTTSQKNRARKEVMAFFNYAVDFYGLSANPISKIKRIPRDRKPQRVPSDKDVARILAATDRWDRNFIIVFLTTGARKGEVLRMSWEDVDFERRRVQLWTRKSRTRELTSRWVEMGETLFNALQDQWKTKLPESDYVFQNRNRGFRNYGDRYSDRRHFIRKLCAKINKVEEKKEEGERDLVESFSYHGLRRWYTSVQADKHKRSLPVLQRLLGHSRPSTTERYVYLVSEDTKAAQEGMDSYVEELMNGSSEEEGEEKVSK
jgi:integrase